METSDLSRNEKQMLQSIINGEVCRMKRRKKELSIRLPLGDPAIVSGATALKERVAKLHELKYELGVAKGFGKYSEDKNGVE